jgi:hypothetical protein
MQESGEVSMIDQSENLNFEKIWNVFEMCLKCFISIGYPVLSQPHQQFIIQLFKVGQCPFWKFLKIGNAKCPNWHNREFKIYDAAGSTTRLRKK